MRGILLLAHAIALAIILSTTTNARAEDSAWVSLLNGKDLRDWTPYFQKLGIRNPDSVYRVSPEGYLHINITVDFNTSGYGHLFYTKRKFSYYLVRSWYRFPTNSYGPNWGQGWNRENNGLMLHSQAPNTMNGKDFPNSIEVQLLGKNNEQNGGEKAKGFKYATTANLCTPGTYVSFKGNDNYTQHCTAAQYPDAWKNTEIPWEDKDGWSDVTVRVLADSLVQHFIHGVKVFEYGKIRLENSNTPVKDGYISVQAEGTSTQFKTLEVLDLVGCMDKNNPAYRTYFVKHDAAACGPVGTRRPEGAIRFDLRAAGGRLEVGGEGARLLEIRRADGGLVKSFPQGEAAVTGHAPGRPGVYVVTVATPQGRAARKMCVF